MDLYIAGSVDRWIRISLDLYIALSVDLWTCTSMDLWIAKLVDLMDLQIAALVYPWIFK